MKIPLYFKSPDVACNAVSIFNLRLSKEDILELDPDGQDEEYCRSVLRSRIKEKLDFGECITLYFNTENDSITLE